MCVVSEPLFAKPVITDKEYGFSKTGTETDLWPVLSMMAECLSIVENNGRLSIPGLALKREDCAP
jgi:hypothetical protein